MTAGDPSRRRTVALYCAATLFFWMAQYVYMPTLPTYAQSKLDSLTLVGTVLSMYGLSQVIVRVPLGIASDWAGRRKPFLLVGFALGGLGALLLAAAGDFLGLLIGRTVTGLAASSWVVMLVAFGSLFPPGEVVRATATLSLFNSVGRVAATAAAGPLTDLGGYQLAFWAAAALSALAIIVLLPAREQHQESRRPSTSGFVRLAARRDVTLPSLLNAVLHYPNWAVSFGFMPVLIGRLGGSGVLQSAFVTLNIGCMAIGNLIAARVGDRWSAKRLGYTTFVVVGAGLILASLTADLLVLAVAQAVIGIGAGIGSPSFMAQSVRHVEGTERASAMGIHQSVYAVGMFAGPALSGWLADAVGLQPMFALTAASCLALGLPGSRMLVDGIANRPVPNTP